MNIQKVKPESLGPKQGGTGERTREGAERKANYMEGREGVGQFNLPHSRGRIHVHNTTGEPKMLPYARLFVIKDE